MANETTNVREGSLDAPTRHALDWKNPEFYEQDAIDKELHRVFDICHGCRRCVSLCNAFPTLFDLVDESSTMEVDGVSKADYAKVVDQCYLCDLCYQTKCPYVPPHPWNVDFPHLMLRAKAARHRRGETKLAAKILSDTTTVGRIATIPIVVDVGQREQPREADARADGKDAGRAPRCAPAGVRRAHGASAPEASRSRGAAECSAGRAHARQGGAVRDVLLQRLASRIRRGSRRGARSQRHRGAARQPRSLLRHAEVRARRSRQRREIQGDEHSRARGGRARRLGHHRRDSVVRADVPPGTAVDVSGR